MVDDCQALFIMGLLNRAQLASRMLLLCGHLHPHVQAQVVPAFKLQSYQNGVTFRHKVNLELILITYLAINPELLPRPGVLNPGIIVLRLVAHLLSQTAVASMPFSAVVGQTAVRHSLRQDPSLSHYCGA